MEGEGFTYYFGIVVAILMMAVPMIGLVVVIFSGIYQLIENIIEFFKELFSRNYD